MRSGREVAPHFFGLNRRKATVDFDQILEAFNRRQVSFLLIGGLNFYLRHHPITTVDVDLWIEDSEENRRLAELALADLNAEWGRDDADWGPVAHKHPGWLSWQAVYCLHTPVGSVDIFRNVAGLASWRQSRANALAEVTSQGTTYFGLSDADMLKCQLALDPAVRRLERVRYLESLNKPHA